MKKVLVIGSVNVDYVSKVKQLPKGNEDIKMEDMFARISGFGWNVANTLKDLDVAYDLFCTIGTGENADEILQVANKLHIPLAHFSDSIHGCTYTLIDSFGNTSGMVIPGIEYSFPYFDLENLFLDEYDAIILSDLEMPNDFLEELLEVLESFDGIIYYATGQHGMILNEDLKNILFSLKPVFLAKPKEILEMANEKEDIVEASRLLSLKSSNRVVIADLSQPFSTDGQVISSIMEEETDCIDRSGVVDAFASSYMIAKMTGLSEEKALMFARGVARKVGNTFETILPQDEINSIREKFANLILK